MGKLWTCRRKGHLVRLTKALSVSLWVLNLLASASSKLHTVFPVRTLSLIVSSLPIDHLSDRSSCTGRVAGSSSSINLTQIKKRLVSGASGSTDLREKVLRITWSGINQKKHAHSPLKSRIEVPNNILAKGIFWLQNINHRKIESGRTKVTYDTGYLQQQQQVPISLSY